MRKLSSSLTFLYKFLLIPFSIFMYWYIARTFRQLGQPDSKEVINILIVACIFTTPLLYFFCGRNKKVYLDGRTLHISNYFDMIEVDISEIESVSGTILLNPELVWIKLRNPTLFGSTIYFMPPKRVRFSFGFSKHPIVQELRELCKENADITGTPGKEQL